MNIKFSESERVLKQLFNTADKFTYKGKTYDLQVVGKPTSPAGEPKTDLYVMGLCRSDNSKIEFKITYKQANADFLENKISSDRALQIFGPEWSTIISKSTFSIQNEFASKDLIYPRKLGRIEEGSITLGWKFELVNKPSGKLSGKIPLSQSQIKDIYFGTNLDQNKKDATVNGRVISNSGVANYYLDIDVSQTNSVEEILEDLIYIDDFMESSVYNNQIYFACKALNYRSKKGKWDGDRPLAVYIDWNIVNEELRGEIIYDYPLTKKGNELALKLINLIEFHKITVF